MNERKTVVSLFAAGAAAGLTLTYIARSARARLRKPITQAMTVIASREKVERFLETRDRVIEALGSKKLLGTIERLEVHDAPAGRGCELYLTMRGQGKYSVKDALRRIKQMLETGEIATGRRYA